MGKILTLTILGIIFGLMLSSLGILAHNYEVNKCKSLQTNTNQEYYDYELKSSCYMAINKPNLNLFWYCLIFGVLFVVLFGGIGFLSGFIWEENSW